MPLPEAEAGKEAAVGEAEGPVVTVSGTETGRWDDDFEAAELGEDEDDEAEDDKDQGRAVKGAWDVLSPWSGPRPWPKGVAPARKAVAVATTAAPAVEGPTAAGMER